jgi:hypothetical protein
MFSKRSLSLFLIILISACAAEEGSKGRSAIESITSQRGKSLPQPSANFQPTDVIPFSPAQVYKAAVGVLDDARVSILNENKEDGRITTDYVAGPSFTVLGGFLGGGNSTRYKYLVSIKSASGGTKLKVTTYLESSGTSFQSWRDVSEDNQTQVRNIQNALIESIEKSLKQ